ncbi:MAG: hypothetical protein KF749_18490 [Bacteroidetes bacterium]|nr:hypothetical protein [Bacteroidota bacterium]MCW5895729.1 hypothetical protein [Bacteroidota bacterium]
MKKKNMKLLVLTLFVLFQQAMSGGNYRCASKLTSDDSSDTVGRSETFSRKLNLNDAGSWFGVKAGFMASGGPISERWAFGINYEYRTKDVLSFPFEGHVVRNREGSSARSIAIISTSLRVRIRPVDNLNMYFQGGIGASPTIPAPVVLYGGGAEWLLPGRVAVGLGLYRASAFIGPHVMAHVSGSL